MLLAVDTSTRRIGLALYSEDGVLHESVWISHNYHTMQLAPAIEAALTQAGLALNDLKAVGVAVGPGSFTGLRIGLALAKGLALARHLPLIGIPTLDVLAYALPVQDIPLAVVIQSGRGRLAVGWYQAGKKGWTGVGQPEVFTLETLVDRLNEPVLLCGELSDEERRTLRRNRRFIQLASLAWSLRRPGFLAEMAWQRWQRGKIDDPVTLAPIYLHYGDPIAS
jgi:tRNA threonylcarbamoyladenosine biosynthesis protein TsaB